MNNGDKIIDLFFNLEKIRKEDLKILTIWLSNNKHFKHYRVDFLESIVKEFVPFEKNEEYLVKKGERVNKIYLILKGLGDKYYESNLDS
jgi:hypothetical protein